ncbi:hypothetical protein Tco_1235985 [Tanacetum coccineum]
MSENKDKYHDTVLDLEARAKKNADVVLKISNSLQGMFMLGPKPMSFYNSNSKHGLGYQNPYTLKKAFHNFVPQKEFSAEQKYFSSSFISSENPSNASSSSSPSETKSTMDKVEKIQRDSIKIQEVRRAIFTTPRIAKSVFEDTTPVVSNTRFSVKTTQSESLDTTSAVSRTKMVSVTPLRAKNKVVQIVMWIVDSRCSKHMTGDHSLLKNFVEKFMGTIRFRIDHFATIIGYGDYVQGNITVCHVYYVEGLGHNLFSIGQFCYGDLEVAFRSNTCYVQNLEGDDLLTGLANPICILSPF